MVFFLVCSFCFHLEHQIYKDFAAKTKSDLNNKMSTINYLFTTEVIILLWVCPV